MLQSDTVRSRGKRNPNKLQLLSHLDYLLGAPSLLINVHYGQRVQQKRIVIKIFDHSTSTQRELGGYKPQCALALRITRTPCCSAASLGIGLVDAPLHSESRSSLTSIPCLVEWWGLGPI